MEAKTTGGIMRSLGGTAAILSIAALGAGACTPEGSGAGDTGREVVSSGSLQPLGHQIIQQLKEEYPVLREERASEPRPSPDANPARVPDRLHGVASERVLQTARGGATFYADKLEGQRTASGIPFRQNQLVAAHRSFPFGTLLRVTNLHNDRSVNVRVVDRGPFGSVANRRRTVIDLSRRAAIQLEFVGAGRAEVLVEVLEWRDGLPATS
jgi:rare lipoprotein A